MRMVVVLRHSASAREASRPLLARRGRRLGDAHHGETSLDRITMCRSELLPPSQATDANPRPAFLTAVGDLGVPPRTRACLFDRVGQKDALLTHGVDIVVTDLGELLN